MRLSEVMLMFHGRRVHWVGYGVWDSRLDPFGDGYSSSTYILP